MIEQTAVQPNVLLVGVSEKKTSDFEYAMDELQSLAEANMFMIVDSIKQNSESSDRKTYVGKGKLMEIKEFCENNEIDIIIFNDELTPSQTRNIEEVISDVEIMDRTRLILDIFASRAQTKEAKLQVMISSLEYDLPRLGGSYEALSRQGGSSTLRSRGGGETKLESDRRVIEAQIAKYRRELKKLVQERQTQRSKRKKSDTKTVALVGYTNVGKSTLMNALLDDDSDKKVYVEDMLFATLQTRVRRVELTDKKWCLLTDTVGFVDNLPHHLIKAFRSTLEEVKEADLLLHVIDSTSPHINHHKRVTLQTLQAIGVEDTPILEVYNKVDKSNENYDDSMKIAISAKNGYGLERLKQEITQLLYKDYKVYQLLIPYEMGNIVHMLSEQYETKILENREDGILLETSIPSTVANKYKMYITKTI
ncbi:MULTISPECIES: GTPase HflX [unclassified Breznakia]|uniref:GTPase HflX n=1 Tax=unclassified Breznakia TaxID=2623764 RepID=UPI002475E786|nr:MULTISPECIES: GTPase HflX [unclassified Breznakia]MDH6367745.1 GTP-binding protein HflX [Breznakia sp. PH1-1]MDH6404833.1 GTP-binding protein HflX [Breznakia sp. PF1-11]MDH6412541.1 GTP-binding protein HflX [Breznakia sp. PFB1-11]MDH6414908.1 GTP-binding protein HflX [Breznakia sp. PFB1-14]MDH6417212.1 GTP-binding protein HflX [Breznakia sp. PFB1-4]